MVVETLEKRVEILEKRMAQLLEDKIDKKSLPWWEKHFGAFKDSPYYEEAMRRGAEYRRSQPTAAEDVEAAERGENDVSV